MSRILNESKACPLQIVQQAKPIMDRMPAVHLARLCPSLHKRMHLESSFKTKNLLEIPITSNGGQRSTQNSRFCVQVTVKGVMKVLVHIICPGKTEHARLEIC